MFDQQGFLAWSLRLGLSDAARLTIDCIRKSEPSRRVGGGRHNVTGRYPSIKMGVTIQFESHRVELPAIYELEHDADVIEYFDQARLLRGGWQALRRASHTGFLRHPAEQRGLGRMQDGRRASPACGT